MLLSEDALVIIRNSMIKGVFVEFAVFVSADCAVLSAAGMIAVALTPNMKIAAVCSSYMYSLFHLFAGFVITQVNMPGWW